MLSKTLAMRLDYYGLYIVGKTKLETSKIIQTLLKLTISHMIIIYEFKN
jgi:hypothetical protein